MSIELRRRHPEVPWRQVVDIRNLLAHRYRYVDPLIVWQVVVRDFPELAVQIRKVLDDLPDAE